MLGIAQLINEAWAYESSDEHEVALRLYKTAFNNLLDINNQLNATNLGKVPGISPFEVRSVADYLNQRACDIHFMLNHPREAITQFRKYIDTFKQHTKSPEYAFEHSAWLSQQYLMFADLFHKAVTSGTKASRSQHPGLYYLEAAMQMIERRENISEYTNDELRSSQMPVTHELLSMITASNFATFLRQCGWTCVNSDTRSLMEPSSQSTSTSDKKETEPIDYSDTIIRALYRAIEHYEEWNRNRMVTYISVLIAEEYSNKEGAVKAQTLYKKSLYAYEQERWTPLVEHIRSRLDLVDSIVKGLA